MHIVLASSWLDSLGQVAAIILAIYLFISIISSLVLVAILMFGFAWIREKIEVIQKLRPFTNNLNRSLHASLYTEPLPPEIANNKVIQAITQVPKATNSLESTMGTIEQKVEYGSERVASAVIELRARTAMVKGIARAFFLPQTMPVRRTISVAQPPAIAQEAAPTTATTSEPPVYEEEMVIVQSSH